MSSPGDLSSGHHVKNGRYLPTYAYICPCPHFIFYAILANFIEAFKMFQMLRFYSVFSFCVILPTRDDQVKPGNASASLMGTLPSKYRTLQISVLFHRVCISNYHASSTRTPTAVWVNFVPKGLGGGVSAPRNISKTKQTRDKR